MVSQLCLHPFNKRFNYGWIYENLEFAHKLTTTVDTLLNHDLDAVCIQFNLVDAKHLSSKMLPCMKKP